MVDFRIDVVVNPRGAVSGTRVVNQQLTTIENRADQARASVSRIFGVLAAGGAVAGAVRTLANFDQAITRAGAVSSASADELERLRNTAEELGATTRFTATDAARGLTFLAQAGFEVTDSIETVDDALRLAQVGTLSLAVSADIATNVLSGFNLGVSEASRFVDVLALAANSSNTNVRQLGDAFSFVAPIAQGVGVSIEEAAAAIGVLSNAGIQGSRAGTGLQRVISRLSNPTAQAEEVLAQLGLTAAEVSVESEGLSTVLERLAASGITATQALVLAGDRGGPAITALTNNVQGIRDLNEQLNSAGGFAEETARRLDDNLQGSLRRVASAFEAVILAVGRSGGTGGLRGLLDSLAEALRFVAANIETVIDFARNLAIVLGPRILLGAVRALTAVLAANPLGLLVIAIATVVTAVPELQEALLSLVQTVAFLGNTIVNSINFEGLLTGFAGAIDEVLALFTGLGTAVATLFDNLGQRPAEVGELIRKGFRDALEATLDFTLSVFRTIGDIILGVGSDIIQLVENVGGAIGALTSGNLAASQAFADNLESALVRSGNRVVTFQGQLQGNLRELQAVDLLDPVELSQGAQELGNQIAQEFARGYDESSSVVSNAVTQSFQRGASNVGQAPEVFQPGSPTATGAGNIGDEAGDASEKVFSLQEQIDALDNRTDFGAGLSRGILRLQQEAEDLAAVGERVANVFADTATDAIITFVETGEFNFREFANSILQELLRIIIRLLVVRALSAALGGAAGSVGVAAASAGSAAATARQSGGPVTRGGTFLVGEDGPELFQPAANGRIANNRDTTEMMQGGQPPQITVVNVQSEEEIPEQINSGGSDAAIINVLGRNRDQVRQILQ